MRCERCFTQSFSPKESCLNKHFEYNNHNSKYNNIDYLYGIELRWSHQQILKFNFTGRKVLEIGCFNGFFVSELHRSGADAYGIELNEKAIEVGEELFNLKGKLFHSLENLDHLPSFDDVICIDVLEHIDDPIQFIRQFSGILKPNGRIFIAGPTVERRFFDKTDYPPHHKWRFSRPGLVSMLEKNGFKVQQTIIQYDGMLALRNFAGKLINGINRREFYGEQVIAPPSTSKGLFGIIYNVFSIIGIAFFKLMRISYCSTVIVGIKE